MFSFGSVGLHSTGSSMDIGETTRYRLRYDCCMCVFGVCAPFVIVWGDWVAVWKSYYCVKCIVRLYAFVCVCMFVYTVYVATKSQEDLSLEVFTVSWPTIDAKCKNRGNQKHSNELPPRFANSASRTHLLLKFEQLLRYSNFSPWHKTTRSPFHGRESQSFKKGHSN